MRYLPFLLLALLLTACATSRLYQRHSARQVQRHVEQSPVFAKSLSGFVLLDPATGKRLCDVRSDKYFIPASNTKILTLYTVLHMLGDSVPGLEYQQTDAQSITIRPTGDPTFLHPLFRDWQQPFEFVQNNPAVLVEYRLPESQITPLGKGWAWDDAPYGYSAERTVFPLYGNVRRVFALGPDSLGVEPAYWEPFVASTPEWKDENFNITPDNHLQYGPQLRVKPDFEREIPVFAASKTINALLADTLHKTVIGAVSRPDPTTWRMLYSAPIDTVLRRMMYQSDNFIAEQMLLVCAGVRFHTLTQDSVLRWMQDSLFKTLPQPVKWVDGSGLSRYNLNTPQNNAEILRRLWFEQPQPRLLSLFPAGGVAGTLKDWYVGPDGQPFVWAKTGSMSGVLCLSGYVRTKRGKMLVFSFMHNNFIGSNKAWRTEMQRILREIWDM